MCTGGNDLPVPLTFPANAVVPNVAIFGDLLGDGVTCTPNALPDV
jgi:hypothetical protein